MNILRYKGKSTDQRFNELEEERRKKKIEDERARLEGRVVQSNPVKTSQTSETDGGLAVASGLCLYVVDVNTKKARQVTRRENIMTALAVHHGKLYHAESFIGNHNIFDTLDNRIVAKRSDTVFALVSSYDGKLYDAGAQCKVFETLTGKTILGRTGHIFALASYDRLYDAGAYNKVYDSTYNNAGCISAVIAQRNSHVRSLAVHDGKVYDAGNYRNVSETLIDKPIADRKGIVRALAFCGGKLYDAGEDRSVFDTFDDPLGTNPVYTFENEIYAMCSLPKLLFDRLWFSGFGM
jgi:hypothetical protein